jgi:hypothetical protein
MEKISKERISELLEKYFEADATLREEEILRDYFRGDVDDQFLEYKPMFSLFSRERESLPEETHVVCRKGERVSFRWISVAVAASVALIMFLSLPEKGDTLRLMIDGVQIDNRELAIEKTDARLTRLQQMLGKYRESNTKLGSMGRAGESVSSLNDLSNILKQNVSGDRLDK